jgi:hypothetical protein
MVGFMKLIMLINIFSIILGLAALSWKGLNYQDREKMTDIGPLQTAREIKKTFLRSPLLSGIAQAGRIMPALFGIRAKNPL